MSDTQTPQWHPDRCPITLRPFFCWIEHPERGLVPTYGGPFDSWTLAEPCEPLKDGTARRDVEYTSERYDHDAGEWKHDETVGLRCVTDELLFRLEDQLEATQRERDDWRECAEKLVEALDSAKALALAWAGHWAMSPAYGGGEVHPTHKHIINQAEESMRRFTELKNRQQP